MVKTKLILIFITISLLASAGYVFLYQRVMNEEQALADNRCLNVNPIITERKNIYLTTLAVLHNSEGIEAYYKANREYIKSLDKYVTAGSAWLEKYNALINRWDFKLTVPQELQAVAKLRGEAFELDKEVSRYTSLMTSLFINEGKGEDDPEFTAASNNLFKTTDQRDKVYADLDVLLNNPKLYDSILNRLIRIQPSKCPNENRQIPDVQYELEKMFNPETSPSASETSG